MSELIAIVDDDSTLRTIVKGILEARGYQVLEADNAAACLKLCDTICPDLILLDALMPEMDGFECCRELRSRFTERGAADCNGDRSGECFYVFAGDGGWGKRVCGEANSVAEIV